MNKKSVLILMGSDSDHSVMQNTADALTRLDISYEMHIASAHRTPQKVMELAQQARDRGVGVIIAGAGMAAHLSGVVSSHTNLPVIGVPLASGALDGLDALLATSQMPRGIPVACMGIGSAGAYNAGLLAASILSLNDSELEKRLLAFRKELADKVEEKDAALQKKQ